MGEGEGGVYGGTWRYQAEDESGERAHLGHRHVALLLGLLVAPSTALIGLLAAALLGLHRWRRPGRELPSREEVEQARGEGARLHLQPLQLALRLRMGRGGQEAEDEKGGGRRSIRWG